jgi:trehalose 6-phosphate phosphatase
MKPLLSEAGQSALRNFLVKPALCLFDFDGTLAPLISNPALVNLPPDIQQQLQVLQRRAPIGIITGRSLADMRKRLEFEPDYLIGNHGLEGLPGWDRRAPANSELCRQWLSLLQPMLSPFVNAVWIEDKTYSLTVHYRNARDQSSIQQSLSACFATLLPAPRTLAGKFNISLLPADAGDKGAAVRQLLQTFPTYRAIYVGDDRTDEDVFVMRHPDIFSVRVGTELPTAADYSIKDQDDIKRLLDLLLEILPPLASSSNKANKNRVQSP